MPFTPPRDGFSQYYEVHGRAPGSAETIVFAHGAGGNHLSWWQQVPAFAPDYTCVTFDARGFGLSRDESAGPIGPRLAGDLSGLLDHLGLERVHLVAQSMGGWACLRLALEEPARVASLVMADTHGGTRGPSIPPWGSAPAPDRGTGFHPACGERMRHEQPIANFLYWQISDLNSAHDPAALRQRLALGDAGPGEEEVRALKPPVLFIAGEEDIVIPSVVLEAAAALIPGARLERVPAAGHSVYFERPARFNALVEAFLGGS